MLDSVLHQSAAPETEIHYNFFRIMTWSWILQKHNGESQYFVHTSHWCDQVKNTGWGETEKTVWSRENLVLYRGNDKGKHVDRLFMTARAVGRPIIFTSQQVGLRCCMLLVTLVILVAWLFQSCSHNHKVLEILFELRSHDKRGNNSNVLKATKTQWMFACIIAYTGTCLCLN